MYCAWRMERVKRLFDLEMETYQSVSCKLASATRNGESTLPKSIARTVWEKQNLENSTKAIGWNIQGNSHSHIVSDDPKSFPECPSGSLKYHSQIQWTLPIAYWPIVNGSICFKCQQCYNGILLVSGDIQYWDRYQESRSHTWFLLRKCRYSFQHVIMRYVCWWTCRTNVQFKSYYLYQCVVQI